MQSKPLFSKKDLASKVMPCVMPLLLDQMTDVRKEAFRVVRDFLEEIQQESNSMTELLRQLPNLHNHSNQYLHHEHNHQLSNLPLHH